MRNKYCNANLIEKKHCRLNFHPELLGKSGLWKIYSLVMYRPVRDGSIVYACLLYNPTKPLNPTPTPDCQLFSTSSKEEEKGKYKTKQKLVIGHQKYKNDKVAVATSNFSFFSFFIGIKSMLVMNNASKMCIWVKMIDRKKRINKDPAYWFIVS